MNSLVIEVEGHSMADKVLCTGLEAELFVDGFHAVGIEVES